MRRTVTQSYPKTFLNFMTTTILHIVLFRRCGITFALSLSRPSNSAGTFTPSSYSEAKNLLCNDGTEYVCICQLNTGSSRDHTVLCSQLSEVKWAFYFDSFSIKRILRLIKKWDERIQKSLDEGGNVTVSNDRQIHCLLVNRHKYTFH